MPRPRLASVFAIRLALTLAAAMLGYAAIERLLEPDVTWAKLAFEHGAHVVTLGILVYAVLLVGFEHAVGRPLRAIHSHLYKIATGRLELVPVESRVREIAEMEASVNLMVRRMRLGAGDADPHRTAMALRDLGARLHDRAPAASEAMVNAAAALELLAPGLDGAQARSGSDPSAAASSDGTIEKKDREDSTPHVPVVPDGPFTREESYGG